MKKEKVNDEYKHYVIQEIGLVKGYRLVNETNENDNIIINDIKIEINLNSNIGKEFWETVKGKFTPESLPSKYATKANYIYSENERNGIMNVAIKILTNKRDPDEVKAKRKLLHKINKYT